MGKSAWRALGVLMLSGAALVGCRSNQSDNRVVSPTPISSTTPSSNGFGNGPPPFPMAKPTTASPGMVTTSNAPTIPTNNSANTAANMTNMPVGTQMPNNRVFDPSAPNMSGNGPANPGLPSNVVSTAPPTPPPAFPPTPPAGNSGFGAGANVPMPPLPGGAPNMVPPLPPYPGR